MLCASTLFSILLRVNCNLNLRQKQIKSFGEFSYEMLAQNSIHDLLVAQHIHHVSAVGYFTYKESISRCINIWKTTPNISIE